MPGLASNAGSETLPPWAAAMLANLALGQPLSLDHSYCLKPTEILQLAQVAQFAASCTYLQGSRFLHLQNYKS